MVNIVYYSNCQHSGIEYFLKKSINDSVVYHLENYSLIKKQMEIPVDIIKRADIFIYQPIDKAHGIYSTDVNVENNIMSYLSPECKTISFPYIYNSSLWILIPPANIDGFIGNYPDIDKYINREPIEKLKSQGYSLDTVLQMYSNGMIDFDYEDRFNKSIEILRGKELSCDVKVSEFIETNVKKHKLFLTQNHPTTCVFVHCANQVLSILGYNIKYDEFSYPENICNLPGEWPTTSYDIKYWKFEYNTSNIQDKWYEPHIRYIYQNYTVTLLYPLSYSIPLKCVNSLEQVKKTRLYSPLIPGDNKTYIYKDEDSYNKNYGDSYFSFTYKKGGYDCLRHYEILANNSIPYYIDIDEIPNKTMPTFPKSIIKNAIHSLINNPKDFTAFDKYIEELHNYTINNLTCEKSAENFIGLLNRLNGGNSDSNTKKILMIANNNINYSMMTLAYGLRTMMGSNFVDFPKIVSLYNKCQYNLHIEDNISIDRSDIENKIKNKYYDYIIFGSIGPDEGTSFDMFETMATAVYKKTEIIYVFGGDRPFNIIIPNVFNDYLKKYVRKGVCFVRELDDNTDYYHETTWSNYVDECVEKWNDNVKTAYSIMNKTAEILS